MEKHTMSEEKKKKTALPLVKTNIKSGGWWSNTKDWFKKNLTPVSQ